MAALFIAREVSCDFGKSVSGTRRRPASRRDDHKRTRWRGATSGLRDFCSGCPYRKLDPYILVMQSTQDRTGEYATKGLDGARNRRVLIQGEVLARLIVVRQI